MSVEAQKYIEKQKSPQKEIIEEVRKIFQKTLPTSEEKMRWGVITYSEGKFYIGAMKNRVHVGFAIIGLSEDEIKMFEGIGKTMRHIKIPTLKDVDEEKLIKLIELVNKKTTCNEC